MYWHWQTVAAFSLQLFTLSCAREAVTSQKLLCFLRGSKTMAGVKLLPVGPPSRPRPLQQLSARWLNLTESVLIDTSNYIYSQNRNIGHYVKAMLC